MQSIIDHAPPARQAVYDHRAWLATIRLLTTVPTWSRNLTRRVKRPPKVFLTDPELAAWLLGKTPDALADPADRATGQLVEILVFAELRRQLTWSATEAAMFHWQDRSGAEVDLILEAADGRVVGIQVKSHQTAKPEWFRWLTQMRDVLGVQLDDVSAAGSCATVLVRRHRTGTLGCVEVTGRDDMPPGLSRSTCRGPADRGGARPVSGRWRHGAAGQPDSVNRAVAGDKP